MSQCLLRCSRINRNIVECKDYSRIRSSSCNSVLIETLWNVKKDRQVIFMDADFSINRNIVECKVNMINTRFI